MKKTPERMKYNCGHNPDGYCQLCLKPLIDRQERSQAPHLTKEKIEEIAVKTFHELWDKLPKLKGEELKRKMKEMGFVPVSHPSRPDERDGLILKMREGISKIAHSSLGQTATSHQEWLNCILIALKLEELPIPASTKKMEAMLKVVEQAKAAQILLDADKNSKWKGLKKALADLEALGAEG